jgi:general nucleoside transport system ATP-binding protein
MDSGTGGDSVVVRGRADGTVSDTALALQGIGKRFGDLQALAGVSLNVRRGTLHAVLGENGAGKTTLMRIVYGMLPQDAGTVVIDGKLLTHASSAEAIRRGVGMVHQHFTLVPTMTVTENVALGGRGALKIPDVDAAVRALCERVGLHVEPSAHIDTLGVGAQQRVEIVKALYHHARLLILDEPTAVLTPQEADELFAWLRAFVAGGGTVVLVTHKLQEALASADDVTVLRRGRVVMSRAAEYLTVDELVRAITGDEPVAGASTQRTPMRGPVIARLQMASWRDAHGVLRVHDVEVACHGGEIIGVAGVEGSGVHELLRLLSGRLKPTSGTADLPLSIGFVPEDRQRDALIDVFTLTENIALRGAGTRRGRMPWSALRAQTTALMSQHDVRAPSAAARVASLSGGNQQKFVVGRELDDRPALVVAENPVRGLDIRATEHVMRELAASASAGSAVVISSADLDDVLPLADRMLVVYGGRVREVPVDRGAVARALVGAV